MEKLPEILQTHPFSFNRHTILTKLRENKAYFLSLGVKQIGLFGSYARGEERNDSDLDFLVEFLEGKKNYDHFMDLCFFLEELFPKKIDLLTRESIPTWLALQIEKEIIYEKFF